MRHLLKRQRTEHAKAVRRTYGDYSGQCRFSDKEWTDAGTTSATITSLVEKEILILEYETNHNLR